LLPKSQNGILKKKTFYYVFLIKRNKTGKKSSKNVVLKQKTSFNPTPICAIISAKAHHFSFFNKGSVVTGFTTGAVISEAKKSRLYER
jgi:hypothetical protein